MGFFFRFKFGAFRVGELFFQVLKIGGESQFFKKSMRMLNCLWLSQGCNVKITHIVVGASLI